MQKERYPSPRKVMVDNKMGSCYHAQVLCYHSQISAVIKQIKYYKHSK